MKWALYKKVKTRNTDVTLWKRLKSGFLLDFD